METHRRGMYGRRIVSPEFKWEQISRVLRRELTLAELSRKLNVEQSVVRRWTPLVDRASNAAVAANEDVVPASELRAAQQRIRKLERLVGKKPMEVEILQAARDKVKKKAALVRRVHAMTGRTVAAICQVLGIGRATAYRAGTPRPARYARAEDRIVVAQIREVIRTRATYGARRTRALVNRAFGTTYNLKRIQRVVELNGWKLPRNARWRTGRAPTGQIQRAVSNERWCSDVLEIACWNGEYVQLGFALDCHDRECLAWVAAPQDLCAADIQQLMQQAVTARFGAGQRPDAPIEWLSDNRSIYTALNTPCTAERLHLAPITTPVASPESNGMSGAFVNTLKRDYVSGADRGAADAVLERSQRGSPTTTPSRRTRRSTFNPRSSTAPRAASRPWRGSPCRSNWLPQVCHQLGYTAPPSAAGAARNRASVPRASRN